MKKDKIKEVMDNFGAFWAFGNEQFEEAKDESVEQYVHIFGGLMCPRENVEELLKAIK
jgi:hypothetical protein